MRLIDEANFLQPGCRARSWIVPQVVLRFAVPGKLWRHRFIRTNGKQLAAAPRLCDGRGRADYAGGLTDAGVSDFSGDRLCHLREDGRRGAFAAHDRASLCGFGFVRVDRGFGCDSGVDGERAGACATNFYGGHFAGGGVSVYGELHGGDADGSVRDFLYSGGADSALPDDWADAEQWMAFHQARMVAREQLSVSGG